MYRKRYEMYQQLAEQITAFLAKGEHMKNVIITVDGPSGAGKGTLCYALAQKLGFALLDSGAIYRVTALAALKQQIALDDEKALAELAQHLKLVFLPQNGEVEILLDSENVSNQIRTLAVARLHHKWLFFRKFAPHFSHYNGVLLAKKA